MSPRRYRGNYPPNDRPAHHTRPAAARLDWRAEWSRRKDAWAHDAYERQTLDPTYRGYCYYAPSAGPAWGELYTFREGDAPPDVGLVLAYTEPIPRGPYGMIRAWLEGFAGGLPVLPTEGDYV